MQLRQIARHDGQRVMPPAVRLIFAGALLALIPVALLHTVLTERGKPAEFWFSLFAIGLAVSAGLTLLILGGFDR